MESIKVKLSSFEGPLDLLLHLIEKAEMDIQDIQLSEITSQYLAYMTQVDKLSMDSSSEFLSVAAQLLYIKSRSLLPRSIPAEETDTDEENPEYALVRKIREYKLYKEASDLLAQLHENASKSFTRLPDEYPLPPPVVSIVEASTDALLDALAKLLLREEKRVHLAQTRELKRDNFTIADQVDFIREKLKMSNSKAIEFSELFPKNGGRIGIIVTFMAILELTSSCEIHIWQQNLFSPISVSAAKAQSII